MRTIVCFMIVVAGMLALRLPSAVGADANSPATRPAVRDASTQPPDANAPARPPRPVADMLTGAIDPYQPGRERLAFFKAAGPDNELDANEFVASRKARDGFVRRYDHWKDLLAFDKNRSGTLDWFEIDAYRQDLRRRVLAAFDADKNGRLSADERKAANEALVAGKVPGEPPALPERARIADAEHPGPGDPEAPPATQPARRVPDELAKWQLKNFDADGDGELSPEEQAEVDKFQKQFAEIGRKFRERMEDLNGDGEVTEEERQELRKQWQAAGLKMIARAVSYMDADGDGTISPEERRGFQQRMQGGMTKYLEKFSESYDADRNGRLDPAEREKLLDGAAKELERRTEKFDADHNGRLSPDEMMDMMEDFVREDLGIKPAPATQPAE